MATPVVVNQHVLEEVLGSLFGHVSQPPTALCAPQKVVLPVLQHTWLHQDFGDKLPRIFLLVRDNLVPPEALSQVVVIAVFLIATIRSRQKCPWGTRGTLPTAEAVEVADRRDAQAPDVGLPSKRDHLP